MPGRDETTEVSQPRERRWLVHPHGRKERVEIESHAETEITPVPMVTESTTASNMSGHPSFPFFVFGLNGWMDGRMDGRTALPTSYSLRSLAATGIDLCKLASAGAVTEILTTWR